MYAILIFLKKKKAIFSFPPIGSGWSRQRWSSPLPKLGSQFKQDSRFSYMAAASLYATFICSCYQQYRPICIRTVSVFWLFNCLTRFDCTHRDQNTNVASFLYVIGRDTLFYPGFWVTASFITTTYGMLFRVQRRSERL
jgi:hypothetical protein